MAETTPKICILYEADASKITVIDETGIADVNNTGGYGTPNLDRNQYATVLQVFYNSYNSERTLINTLEDNLSFSTLFDNTEKTKHVIPYYGDGWYEFVYTLVPTTIDPIEGNIYYDPIQEVLLQYDTVLDPVNVLDFSVLEDASIYSLVKVTEFPLAKLTIKKNELSRDYFACKKCVDCSCEEEFKNVLFIREGIQASKAMFEIAPFEAQNMVERLTKQYKINGR